MHGPFRRAGCSGSHLSGLRPGSQHEPCCAYLEKLVLRSRRTGRACSGKLWCVPLALHRHRDILTTRPSSTTRQSEGARCLKAARTTLKLGGGACDLCALRGGRFVGFARCGRVFCIRADPTHRVVTLVHRLHWCICCGGPVGLVVATGCRLHRQLGDAVGISQVMPAEPGKPGDVPGKFPPRSRWSAASWAPANMPEIFRPCSPMVCRVPVVKGLHSLQIPRVGDSPTPSRCWWVGIHTADTRHAAQAEGSRLGLHPCRFTANPQARSWPRQMRADPGNGSPSRARQQGELSCRNGRKSRDPPRVRL